MGLDKIGVNLPLLIAQIINVAILFALLYFVAYKPILKMFDQRSQKIKESMEQTERIKVTAANAETESRKQIEEARRQGQEIIAQATKNGEEIKQRANQDAQKEAQAVLERERLLIEREKKDASEELRHEFADLTILAAGKVIEKSLDKKAHQELIDKVLEESDIKGNG